MYATCIGCDKKRAIKVSRLQGDRRSDIHDLKFICSGDKRPSGSPFSALDFGHDKRLPMNESCFHGIVESPTDGCTFDCPWSHRSISSFCSAPYLDVGKMSHSEVSRSQTDLRSVRDLGCSSAEREI